MKCRILQFYKKFKCQILFGMSHNEAMMKRDAEAGMLKAVWKERLLVVAETGAARLTPS
jgi:hypothetical protein